MRRRLLFLLLAATCSQISSAQEGMVGRWDLAVGVVFPAAPDQFYDYWKQGFQLMVGAELSGQSRFVQVVVAEVNYFAFHEERFLKRLEIENGGTSVDGASTFIFALDYVIKYPFTEYEHFQPAFFAGLGCASSLRSSATVSYPNYSVPAESQSSIMLTVPLGVSFRVFHQNASAFDVSFGYTIGFSRDQAANSNYTSMKLVYSFSN